MDHNHIIRFLLIICGTVTFGIGSGLAWFFSLDIPNIQSVDDYQPLVTTTVLDNNGRMIDAIYEENRIVLRFDEMNPLIPMAFVAAEDGQLFMTSHVPKLDAQIGPPRGQGRSIWA